MKELDNLCLIIFYRNNEILGRLIVLPNEIKKNISKYTMTEKKKVLGNIWGFFRSIMDD